MLANAQKRLQVVNLCDSGAVGMIISVNVILPCTGWPAIMTVK